MADATQAVTGVADHFSMIDVWSLVGSITSILLAVLAIALSIWFFIISTNSARETTKASESVAHSVLKLETLFDRLYADTFSMMRETVTDMRRHVWPEGESEEEDAETEKAIQELRSSLSKILEHQQIADGKVEKVLREFSGAAQATMAAAPIGTRSLRMAVLSEVRNRPFRSMTAEEIVTSLGRHDGSSATSIVRQIERLKAEGVFYYEGSNLNPSTVVQYITPREREHRMAKDNSPPSQENVASPVPPASE